MNIDNVEKVIRYGRIILDLADSNVLTWEEKYDSVFHINRKITELGYKIDYYDPDTSYEEDVAALCGAITRQIEVWEEIMNIKNRAVETMTIDEREA
jgi:hypothetical protein